MDGIKSVMGEPLEIGEWKQISVLGSGAFGVVTLWRHQETEENVAIKRFKKISSVISSKQTERWNKEIEFMKSCNHQNLVKFKFLPPDFENILQKYNPSKLPLMTMEYCTKGNLRRFLLSEPIKLCGLKESDARCVLKDVLCGLNYLHSKKITHRDLKPENVVLQHCDIRSGNNIYKIIDLGYAKELEFTIQSQVGTVHYLAPEIFENKPYDHSVDYWSMGLLVFEMICGVLPFLPEMTPFERFQKIREKGPDDICIYMQFSGAIANSTELKKENFITACFKHELETWLKCVLQYESTKRCSLNSLGVFEHLQFILDKKIVKVFSLHKLEFFSYEFNESTRMGTLKEWISRDVKIPKNDLMVLFDGDAQLFFKDDEKLIFDVVTDQTIIFVVKKGALLNDKIEFNPPKSIKELLFSSGEAFPQKFARNLYRQCLFFVYTEKKSVDMLKQASPLFLKYLKIIHKELQQHKNSACEAVTTLLKDIKKHMEERKITCDLDLSENTEAKECLRILKRLLASCERSLVRIKEFLVQFEALKRLNEEIMDRKVFQDGLDACNIDEQFSKINSKHFLETKNGEPDIVQRLAQVISQTMRLKTKHIHKNEMIRNWFKDFCTIVSLTEQLTSWAEHFIIHLKELSNSYKETYQKYHKILQEEAEKQVVESQVDPTVLLKENEDLRYQFDDVLSQSVLAHKNYTTDLDSMF